MTTDFTDLIDLAAERFGGAVLAANDEFFAPKEALLKPGPPEWREGVYTERGKWMDGWETRRRRAPGHDWAIIRLGAPGRRARRRDRHELLHRQLPRAREPRRAARWRQRRRSRASPAARCTGRRCCAEAPLDGNALNAFAVEGQRRRVTHLRLNIFPDGGVARLRVHGDVVPDARRVRAGARSTSRRWRTAASSWRAATCTTATGRTCILPGRSTHMGDGWETKRRRGPGHDWSIVRLARRGAIDARRARHRSLQGQRAGALHARVRATRADMAVRRRARRRGASSLPETPLEPHARHTWYEFDSRRRRRTCGSTSIPTAASRASGCSGSVA